MVKNIVRVILIILLCCTFSIIFGFSSQTGTKSAGISRKITEIITSNVKSIQEKSKIEKEQIMKKIEHIVRKLAHFSIYALVGILVMLLCKTYNLKNLDRIAITMIISIIYATSDEIHQIFVNGRGPMFTDVLIDTFGAFMGMSVVLMCSQIKDVLNK